MSGRSKKEEFMFDITKGHKYVIGLVHLAPLPGTPLFREGDLERSIEKALVDTTALIKGGADGCLIQSVDKIYPSGDDTDYARVAGMTIVVNEVKRIAPQDFHVGVQLMWNCITPSIAIAKAAGACFTRCSALIGTIQTPYGEMNADPLKVQTYRRNIGAWDSVSLISEISGYHHIAGGYDKNELLTKARQSVTVGANAIEVFHPDEETNNRMVQDIKSLYPDVPVILGGGTNLGNAATRLKYADGALVGGCFENGKWGGNIDRDIVSEYVSIVRGI